MPKLTYYGHSTFVLEGGGSRIAIDPFFANNPHTNLKPEDVRVDYIILTHGHFDHLGDAVQIAKQNDATIIASFELASYCESQGARVHPMHIGGAFTFPFGRVKLTQALHGSAALGSAGLVYTGSPCGVLVTVEDRMVYHAGDTGLFSDMRLIGEMNTIDVALLPIGDNFTMGTDDAVKAAELLNAKLSIPMHYNTWPPIQANPAGFVKKVESLGRKARVLKPGESYTF